MRFRLPLSIAFSACCLCSSFAVSEYSVSDVFKLEGDLKFESLFPRRSFYGQSARIAGWSQDDRYLAYIWNPQGEAGSDLYLYDSVTKQSQRMTSIDWASGVDPEAKEEKKNFLEDQKRLDVWDSLGIDEYRVERQKFKEEREKNRTPRKNYAGISAVVWSKKSNEFLMNYSGEIYRWVVGHKEPTRLTWTRENESIVQYLPDDSGFIFSRGTDYFRMNYDSPAVVQINPELPAGVSLSSATVSPDGTKLLVSGFKPGTAPNRQVDYIVYRDRFAQARKTERAVADDDFNGQSFLYLFDIREETLKSTKSVQKAFEIWKWEGGEDWQEASLSSNPWSPDGSSIIFGTWRRDAKDFKVMEADLQRRKVRPVYIGTSDGDQNTPGFSQPFYTKDGKEIVTLLDKSGWRQVHVLERVRGADRQLTKGAFETYPLELGADENSVIVTSSKNELSERAIYRVALDSGEMTEISKDRGRYELGAKAKHSDTFAGIFRSWNQLPELVVSNNRNERLLTDSHRKEAFWANIKQKPELFTFKNPEGQDVHGYMFLPPGYKKGDSRPLFIYVYGGPIGDSNSVENGAFNSSSYLFNMYLSQVLGYVTCTIDPRGQSGYSNEFGKANWDQPGVKQTEDITSLVDHMAKEYNIDRTKVGLTGWSFGGFQTQHVMYTAPDVVTLGIAGAGPTEWQNYNNWYSGGVIGNAGKGKPEDLDKYSLTHAAKNLKHPLLLLHGMEDTNVLFQDTVMVYRKLLQAGKGPLVELSLDPTGGHGMGGDMDNRDRHEIYLAFLIKHWGISSYPKD